MENLSYLKYNEAQRIGLYEMLKNQKSEMTDSEKVLFAELDLYFNRKKLVRTINSKYDSACKVSKRIYSLERWMDLNIAKYNSNIFKTKEEQLKSNSRKSNKLVEEIDMLVNGYKLTLDEFEMTKLAECGNYEDYIN